MSYGFQLDTDPDALGSFFSGASVPDGFGPGDYSGGYTGESDRVYWGPDAGGPVIYPPPAQLAVNTTPDKFNTHLHGGGIVKRTLTGAVKGTQALAGGTMIMPTDSSASSTGQTVLLPRSETSSIVLPGGPAETATGTASGRSYMGSVTDAGTEGGFGARSYMSDWSETLPNVPEAGTVVDESIYDGDSYHGVYSEDAGTEVKFGDAYDLEGKEAEAPPEAIEMQEMRGPPSLHPDLDADGRWSGRSVESGPSLLSDESPLLLGDTPAPPNSVFDFNSIDWSGMTDTQRTALGDYMTSDAAAESTFLSSEGIGQNLGLFSRAGFANFVQSRMTDLGVGVFLTPLFEYIDEQTETPWVSRGINGAMALYGLYMGDPFGAIALPITMGIQELQKQAARKLDNDHPDANYGKRFGFVREGHKWYPAYLTRSERDEGWLGSDRTQIRMSYGTDLKFKRQKGTGKMIPYFDEGTYRQKDFHVWDNELDTTNEQSGKRWRDQSDPLRDFYFLSEDETTDFLQKLSGGDTVTQYAGDSSHVYTAEEQEAIRAAQKSAFDMMKPHDDVSWSDTWAQYGDEDQKAYYAQYDQYTRTLQDVRSGLELWQDYLTSEPGNIYTTHADEDQYSGARAFRRVLNDSGYLGYRGQQKGQMHRPKGSTAAEMQENALEASGRTAEGDWLVKERFKAVSVLYESQKRAGLSMHYDKLFGDLTGVPDQEDVPGWLKPVFAEGENEYSLRFRGGTAKSDALHKKWDATKGSIEQYAWRLYTDGTWEIGDVTTDAGLKDALRQIEAAGDSSLIGTSDYRSATQRDYLANKAYVRYLDHKLDQLGLSGASPFTVGDPEADAKYRQQSQGYLSGFGLPPQYSYADDFAKWGYNLPPSRYKWEYDQIKKYGIDGNDEWRDYRTQDPDFKLSEEDLRKAQEVPEWLQQVNHYIIKDGVTPDQVAGRYASAADYQKALKIVSERDPVYWDPADEAPAVVEQPEQQPEQQPWDPWGDGVPLNELPYDTIQKKYVQPKDKTPGLVYDQQSGTYVVPNHAAVQPEKPKADVPEATAHGGDDTYADDFWASTNTWNEFKEADPEPYTVEELHQMGFSEEEIADLLQLREEPPAEEVPQPPPAEEQPPPAEEVPQPPAEQPAEEVPIVHTIDPVESKPITVPDADPTAGAHVHEEAPDHSPDQPSLPAYMQRQHRDRVFQHSSAPMHLPPAATQQTKVV